MPQRVRHKRYGEGEVLAQRFGGYELQVRFSKDGRIRWVRLPDIAYVSSPQRPPPRRRGSPSRDDGRFTARRVIEALRLGIVPFDCAAIFMCGRSKEMSLIERWLSDPSTPVLRLIGEYGTGKTHLAQYACTSALKQGFAVSYVQIDPSEAPFHYPKYVYRAVVRALRFREPHRGGTRGFRALLCRFAAHDVISDHTYLKHIERADVDPLIWDWIEAADAACRPNSPIEDPWGYLVNRYAYLPGMYPYSTAANIYTYLLTGLGACALRCGLKGLAIVFDESESLQNAPSYYHYEKGCNFLMALLRSAAGHEELLGPPQDAELDYCRVGCGPEIPFLYTAPPGLKLLFATTPGCEGYFTETGVPSAEMTIKPLGHRAKLMILEQLLRLYDAAYTAGLTAIPSLRSRLAGLAEQAVPVRYFVKACVELLDHQRLCAPDSTHDRG